MNKKLENYINNLPPKIKGEIWSDEQRVALTASGEDILVSAGAGSGKTAVLTERIIRKLKQGESLNNLIILTFTNDAATEMKERIRSALQKEIKAAYNEHLSKELAILDTANVSTFDAFSLKIVKTYHYLLNLKKDLAIGDSGYLEMIKHDIMDEVMLELFSDELIKDDYCLFLKKHSLKSDELLREILLSFYDKTADVVDTDAYLDNYLRGCQSPDFGNLICRDYLNLLKKKAVLIGVYLRELTKTSVAGYKDYAMSLKEAIAVIEPCVSYKDFKKINLVDFSRKPGLKNIDDAQKEAFDKPLKKLKNEVNLLCELTKYNELEDIITEYNQTIKDQEVIIYILKKFNQRLMAYKTSHAMFEFIDIAKLAIKLLEENESVRTYIRNETHEILVDEYQDTSVLQDYLIKQIANNNVYMVGDIKQSIYRFRHASPDIFKNKYKKFATGAGGLAIDLVKNFRSRSEVISDINRLFSDVMDETFGGVNYVPNHVLRFGLVKYDEYLSLKNYDMRFLTYSLADELKKAHLTPEAEATIIVEDIKKHLENKTLVFDKNIKEGSPLRPCRLNDFVILVMNRTEYTSYIKVFEKNGIPLLIDSTDNYLNSNEIYFLLHALRLSYCYIDEEFKKAYYQRSLIGFLRSFVVEASDNLISNLLLPGHSFEKDFPVLYEKIKSIADIMIKESLEDVINAIYDEFSVLNQLIKIGKVTLGIEKLNYFYNLSKGLSNSAVTIKQFITYLEYLVNNKFDIEFKDTSKAKTDAVLIMTIHKSKGLEFPFCYFSSLYKKFNDNDLKTKYIADIKYGFILPYMDDGLKETALKELYKEAYKEEDISEHIRLLYVALTRAKEQLIFVLPKEQTYHELTIADKYNYKSFADIFNSIYDKWSSYEEFIFTDDFTFDDLTIEKKFDIVKMPPFSKKDLPANTVKEIITETASTSVKGLISPETQKLLDLGNTLHYALEQIKISEYPNGINNLEIRDHEKIIIKAFYESEFIKSLDIINEYHELPFMTNNVSGIIDLLIETNNEFIIIDYKTSNIDKESYERQLYIYKEYIKTKTSKKVLAYLYSLMKHSFKEV